MGNEARPRAEPSLPRRAPGNVVHVGRQPIFDRRRRVVGYELLFRDGEGNRAVIDRPDDASRQVLANTLLGLGLERVVASKTAYLNVTGAFVASGLHRLLPPARVVLELIEDEAVDDELVRRLHVARAEGYRIALDDFVAGSRHAALLGCVDVVKLDFRANAPAELAELVPELRSRRLTTLAEKVETREDLDVATECGVDLFQGFFFQRPEVVEGRRVDADRMAVLQLLVELEQPDGDLARLEVAVAADPGLAYRLLLLVNSAGVGLPRRVATIREAVVLLGMRTVRNLALLVMLARVGGKPGELTGTAMVRAKMCELLAADAAEGHAAFTAGLLSLIDGLLDAPMAELVATLPLTDAVACALRDRTGPLGRLLEVATAYERLDVLAIAARRVDPDEAAAAYLEAVAWADRVRRDLLAP